MLTAVQERQDEDLECLVVFGEPEKTKQGSRGSIKLFKAGQVVLFSIRHGRQIRGYFFRTEAEGGPAQIPGVYPGVNLLVEVSNWGQIGRLKNTLDYLLKCPISPAELSEEFYLRLNTLISGREYALRHLKGILEREAV